MKEQRGVLNLRFLGGSFAITMLCGTAVPVSSQEQIPGSADISVPFEEISNVSAEGIVNYPAAFFQKYQPNTALDMVRQIPGFRINNGGQSRGFGTSSGNILIDDRRPSTKQDGPVAILGRIPAARVERIELITTAVRDIDMQGLPAVANIHLKGEAPMAVRWQTSMGKNFEYDPLEMGGNISLSHSWKDVDYNTGFNLNRFIFSEFSTEELYDGDNVFTEQRLDDRITKGTRGSFNLNASTWLGQTFFQFNTEIEIANFDGFKTTRFEPQFFEPSLDQFDDERDEKRLEAGIDMERALGQDLTGKLILLFTGEDETSFSLRQSLDLAGVQTGTRTQDTDEFESESIVRLELDWGKWTGHTINLNLEGAYNILDNSDLEIEDEGEGPVVVDIPGSDIRVEEIRGDFLLSDIILAGNIVLELGLGAEVSRMSQSGDANQVRRFIFLKPSSVLTYTPVQGRTFTLTMKREVAQLDFNDFVSAALIDDDDELALGNPNLRPDTTWLVDLSYEHRFGNEAVIELSGYYRWISDLQDLIPLTDTEEAPGNIGNGSRWGIFLEGSVPLDLLGMTNAKLNFFFRRRGTEAVDPVTGRKREFSINNPRNLKYSHNLNFRQDFVSTRMAWGVNANYQSDRPFFKVNELDVHDNGINLNTFIESSRWFGIKMRLNLNNVLNSTDTRNRTIFTGRRDLSPLEALRFEKSKNGREIQLTLSGSF